MNRVPLLALAMLGTLAFSLVAQAEVKLAMPFSDHLVLQRDLSVPVWGEAEAGEAVTVEFAGQTKATTAGADGKWSVKLDPLRASAEPRVLTIKGKNTIVLQDVLVGEVWLCSGQSNMEATLERLKRSAASSPAAHDAVVERCDRELATSTPGLRLFRVGTARNDTTKNVWLPCSREGLARFSATAYFFAKDLLAELKVPVGVIESAVGGTRIETWTPAEGYAALPAFQAEAAANPLSIDGVVPGKNYKTMVQPLRPFSIRGVLWYQGESNVIELGEDLRYADKMEALIRSWRALWGEGELPFYYVQLPRLGYSKRRSTHPPVSAEALAWFREGQGLALRVPNTGMAITIDLVDTPGEIHPNNKWDVGHRLALLALANTYGRQGFAFLGPVYKAMERRDDKIRLSFDHIGQGLVSKDGKPLTDFTIAGADRKFMPAEAEIQGEQVLVWSPAVSNPEAVRFGWHELAKPNLCNREGLPAGPFRTDNWPASRRAPQVPAPAAAAANGK